MKMTGSYWHNETVVCQRLNTYVIFIQQKLRTNETTRGSTCSALSWIYASYVLNHRTSHRELTYVKSSTTGERMDEIRIQKFNHWYCDYVITKV